MPDFKLVRLIFLQLIYIQPFSINIFTVPVYDQKALSWDSKSGNLPVLVAPVLSLPNNYFSISSMKKVVRDKEEVRKNSGKKSNNTKIVSVTFMPDGT